MELVYYIAIVGGATLLLGVGIFLVLRLATRGREHRQQRFAVLASLMSALAVVLGVVHTLEGDFVWQGVLHFVLAGGWLVLWHLHGRAPRTRPEGG